MPAGPGDEITPKSAALNGSFARAVGALTRFVPRVTCRDPYIHLGAYVYRLARRFVSSVNPEAGGLVTYTQPASAAEEDDEVDAL